MKKCVKFLFLLAVCVLSTLSCGYHVLIGAVPGDKTNRTKVIVENTANHTPYPDLASAMTSALRKKTVRIGIEIENKSAAAARLKTVIKTVSDDPGTLRGRDGILVPVDYIVSVEVEAHLEDAFGQILRSKKTFAASARSLSYSSAPAREASLNARRTELLDDLAGQIVMYIFVDRKQ